MTCSQPANWAHPRTQSIGLIRTDIFVCIRKSITLIEVFSDLNWFFSPPLLFVIVCDKMAKIVSSLPFVWWHFICIYFHSQPETQSTPHFCCDCDVNWICFGHTHTPHHHVSMRQANEISIGHKYVRSVFCAAEEIVKVFLDDAKFIPLRPVCVPNVVANTLHIRKWVGFFSLHLIYSEVNEKQQIPYEKSDVQHTWRIECVRPM